MDLRPTGLNVVSATVDGIQPDTVRPLGGYLIGITMRLVPVQQTARGGHLVLDGLTADVSVVTSDGDRYLGRARPTDGLARIEFSLDQLEARTVALRVEVTADRLEALDKAREGGDVTFRVALAAQVRYSFPSGTGPSYEGIGRESCIHVVPQSNWATMLDRLRFTRTLLIEVPLPVVPNRPDLQSALRSLEEAQHFRLTGKEKDAVGRCREALEALAGSAAPSQAVTEVRKTLNQIRATTDKEQRILILREVVRFLTHLAHHSDPLSAGTSWSRDEATLVVAATGELLKLQDS